MSDKKFSESEVINLIKRIAGVEEDGELVEWLNDRYNCNMTKQKISNYRVSGDAQMTITKVMLHVLAEHLDGLNKQSSDVK